MATIIVKPTDQSDPNYATELATYTAQIEGIRILASPDVVAKFTDTELPESIIANDVYLAAKEREVLKDTNIDAPDVSSQTDAIYQRLVYMTQLLVAIELKPQLAQIIRQRSFSTDTQLQTVDWEAHIARWLANYNDELIVVNPAANVVDTSSIPVAGATTKSEEIDFDVSYYNRTELYGRTP